MAESQLKISILTPSFNSEPYLERAIKSVLNQDYPHIEHIVVDGGSTDGTPDILKKHPHLRWISEPDEGQSDAMNKAFSRCTGDIIGYLNADDWYEENVFSKVIEVFAKDEECKMVVGNLYVHRNGQVRLSKPHSSYDKILLNYWFLFPNNPVSYFYRREVQEYTGPFPVSNYYSMDHWFLLEAFRKYDSQIRKIDLPLGHFFFHETNKTNDANPLRECAWNVSKHLLKHFDGYRFLRYWWGAFRFASRKKIKKA